MVLWVLFRRSWGLGVETDPTMVGLGARNGSIGGALWLLWGPWWGLVAPIGRPRVAKGIPGGAKRGLWVLLKTSIFLSVYEVLGAWGLPVGIKWTLIDPIWHLLVVWGGPGCWVGFQCILGSPLGSPRS